MRVMFMGCVKSSYIFLETLINNGANIVGVVTKRNSNYNSDFMDITPLCEGIPLHYTENVNDDVTYEFIRNINPDILFCFGWSYLISNRIIDLFDKGAVGYHPAALPNNRGRHPIIWALALGLEMTASTFFMMQEGADTGDIVSQKFVPISDDDNAGSLMEKLLVEGKQQVIELYDQLEKDTVTYIKQNSKNSNNWRKRTEKDGLIDWRMSAKNIFNLVRALDRPYVGAHFIHNSRTIKVWKAEIEESNEYKNIEPGKVIDILEGNIILIKTGDNLIKLLEYDNDEFIIGEYL